LILKASSLSVYLFLFVFTCTCFAQEEMGNIDEGRKHLHEIAEEIEKLSRTSPMSSSPGFWKVSPDIIIEPRDREEDKLRMYLLASFEQSEKRDRIAEIVNQPWSDDTVEALWNAEQMEQGVPRGKMLNLIMFVAKKYKGEVFSEVKTRLGNLFEKYAQPNWRSKEFRLGSFLISSLKKYGTVEMLPDSFWRLLEREDMGYGLLNVLSTIGDLETLEYLEKFSEACHWTDEKSLKRLKDTIDKLRVKYDKVPVETIPEGAYPFEIQRQKMIKSKDLLVLLQQDLDAGRNDDAVLKYREFEGIYREVQDGKISKKAYREQIIETWKMAQEDVYPRLDFSKPEKHAPVKVEEIPIAAAASTNDKPEEIEDKSKPEEKEKSYLDEENFPWSYVLIAVGIAFVGFIVLVFRNRS